MITEERLMSIFQANIQGSELKEMAAELLLSRNIIRQQEQRIAELEAAMRWVPVEERLPEKDSTEQWEAYDCLLNVYGEIKRCSLWFIGGSWYAHHNTAYQRYDDWVIKWRPIQPPQDTQS